jgi:hypothetical protein
LTKNNKKKIFLLDLIKNIQLKKVMNPLTITPLAATNVATNGNTVTPSTAPERQNFTIPIIPT